MKYIIGGLVGYVIGSNWGKAYTEWTIFPTAN